MARLESGDPAPAFTLNDQSGRSVSLADYAGRHLVVFFYPAAMTPGCTTEACDFRDSTAALQQAGYEIVGISPDESATQREFAEKESLAYPLLADTDKAVLSAYGAWGEKSLYGKKVTGVIRSTFVVDEKGTIEQAQYNVRATGHVAKLLRELSV